MLKIFLRIIIIHLRGKIIEQPVDIAMVLAPVRHYLAVLVRKCDIHENVYACFMDNSKAFDNDKHGILVDALETLNLNKLVSYSQSNCFNQDRQ